MKNRLTLVIVAVIGGGMGWSFKIPLGTLLGTIITLVVYQLFRDKLKPLSLATKKIIQSLVGGMIGLTFTNDTVHTLLTLWRPSLLLLLSHLCITCLVILTLVKLLKWDYLTAISSAAPAGLSEIVVITDGMKLPMTTIVSIHLFRVIIILITIPISIALLF